jgi:hypothetical protein
MGSVLNQYLSTALWSSLGDDDVPFDRNFGVTDIYPGSVIEQETILNSFLSEAWDLLDGLDLTDVAHDFWLTRNRHGSGFWDGDYPSDIGEKLTKLALQYGECHLFMDDGLIYFNESK